MGILGKLLVGLTLLAIVGSLASAAVFLIRDGSDSRRVVRALTIRVGLSIGLFLILIALVLLGVIEPNHPYQRG
jgi:hypothetical protein